MAAAEFDMGRVVRRTFTLLRADLPTFAGLSVLLIGLPQVVAGIYQAIPPTRRDLHAEILNGLVLIVAKLLPLGIAALAEGAMAAGALKLLAGDRISLESCLGPVRPRLLRLIRLNVIANLLTGLAFVVFVVPGFMVMTRWSVSVPALMDSDRTAMDALSVSARFTQGCRWRIFAMGSAYVFGNFILELTLQGLGGGFSSAPGVGSAGLLAFGVLRPLVQMIVVPIGSVGVTSLYQELRGDRPSAASTVAAVFD